MFAETEDNAVQAGTVIVAALGRVEVDDELYEYKSTLELGREPGWLAVMSRLVLAKVRGQEEEQVPEQAGFTHS
jgi:hypothetical protein